MEATVNELPSEEGREGHGDHRGAAGNAGGCRGNLELRLGMAAAGNGGCPEGRVPRYFTAQDGLGLQQRELGLGLGGGSKRCIFEATGGFVHPWSLAARQEKAALEQAHQKTSPCSTVSRAVQSQRVVGWPPIRSFRRNLGVQSQPKYVVNSEEKVDEIKDIKQETGLQVRTTMFVKVNMEGCTVGRKIDLNLYNGYDSLSHALQKMFHNFFSVNYLNNPEQDERDELVSPCYILLYEDNEGDRMLVGDVPWELFISSAKRLYITVDPRACKCG